MECIQIPFSQTGQFSELILDYLANDPKLAPFFHYSPDMEGFEKIIQERKFEHNTREILVNSLIDQHKSVKSTGEITASIESLRSANTFTVTTGHQLNLFTGPLYFIYKIASTISLARKLKSKFPNYNFVPVYWMATEDHDFAEINHTYLFNNKIEWTPEVSGSTGKIKTDGIEETIEQLKEILGQSPFAETAISKIEDAYIKEDNLASATRTLAYSLFGNEGLVVIDADQKELKKVFAPYIEDDILNERSHSSILTAKNKLEKHYKLPVNPREINFFYLQDNFRERIVKNENHEFEVLNSSIKFSEEELTTEIKNNPQYFSPNVAMRPLYQELILPNLAYIGGPSEIAYWFELCDTFIEFGQKLPVLLLRDCLMLVDKTSLKKIEKLGFKLEDAFKDKDDLIKDYVKSNSTMQLSLTEEVIAIENTFEKIKEKAVAIEPNLNKTVEGEKTKALNHLKSLEQKLLRAEKQKHETAINQIEGVKEKLFPNNVPQERKENFLTWYIKNGDDFIANIISTTNPLDKVFKILY